MIRQYYLRDKRRVLTRSIAYDIIKSTHVTEKSVVLSKANRLVLKVAIDANKIDIQRAVEIVLGIPVAAVNTMITKPRLRGFRGEIARRSPFKKAIITVKKGFDLSKVVGEA
jgi:large subunit ribosomal protein L23